MEQKPKPKRGFAAMSREKNRELASKGGRKAQDAGKAHRFTSEEARAAGSKGGTKRGEQIRAMSAAAKERQGRE